MMTFVPVGFLPDGCISPLCCISIALVLVPPGCCSCQCATGSSANVQRCGHLDWVDRILLIPVRVDFFWTGPVKRIQDLRLVLLQPHRLVHVLRRLPVGPPVWQLTCTLRPSLLRRRNGSMASFRTHCKVPALKMAFVTHASVLRPWLF
uniref:Secreted protein n=1 Tax=Arundo donax TaxID=35708 RepID=A0A0A9ECA5_ARUDO